MAARKTLAQYLGTNPNYINALAKLNNQYNSDMATNAFKRNSAATDYSNQIRQLAQSYMQAREADNNSFAGRGLINSGLFVKANNDLNNQQSQQTSQAQTAYQTLLNQLASQRASLTSGVNQGRSTLQQQAAQQYYSGLGKY